MTSAPGRPEGRRTQTIQTTSAASWATPVSQKPAAADLVFSSDPPKVRVSDWQAAERSSRHHALDKMGIKVPGVPVFYDRLVEALIVSKNLTEAEALVPENVIAAIAEIVADWMHVSRTDLELLKSASRVRRRRKKGA